MNELKNQISIYLENNPNEENPIIYLVNLGVKRLTKLVEKANKNSKKIKFIYSKERQLQFKFV